MMIIGDKKKMVQSIIAKLKPEGGMEVESGEIPQDAMPAKVMAVKKFISCLKSENAEGCAAALTDFIHLVESEEDKEEEYEE